LKILVDCSIAIPAWAKILDATLITKAMRARRFTMILIALLNLSAISELS
jgi:hypothetical protein